MESMSKKYMDVQTEIARLIDILITQTWMPLDQAQEEAIKIEARTRREYARSHMDDDWYSWVEGINNLPQERHEDCKEALAWL